MAHFRKTTDIRSPSRVVGGCDVQAGMLTAFFQQALGLGDINSSRKYPSAVFGHYPLRLYIQQCTGIEEGSVYISYSKNFPSVLLHQCKHGLYAEGRASCRVNGLGGAVEP